MKKSKDLKVQQFLDDMLIKDNQKAEIIIELRNFVFTRHSDISERFMYGGIMFSKEEDVGGIFSYKNHVTFEFSNGNVFDDSKELLEGTGKFRRNIKIKNIGEITEKEVSFFIEQM